ncbi:hypothetical protein LshimejAT787_2900110 [Lyophyllum shimeji]|uniref:Integrase catalytic domain-containing protein n=1 Tax=Lyophyllum shimeji TaxID=47721 RepID=A0A9P3Q297_LYOSH|nr:hypothetical protein LshimejAT787_2900110 [Lyophyllum shimeji]
MTMSTPIPSDASHPSIPLIRLQVPWSASNKKLDRTTGEFNDWSEDLSDALTVNGLLGYVFDPIIPCPPADTEPRAHANWIANDSLARGFISLAIEKTERDGIPKDKGAKAFYEALKSRANGEGPVKQVALIREAFSTYCSATEPLPTTAMKICDIIDRAFAMGNINKDLFKCIALLNALNDDSFRAIQSNVSRALSESTATDPYTSSKIRRLLETEQTLINSKSRYSTANTALAAKAPTQKSKTRVYLCDRCKELGLPYEGHTKPWCTQKGGGCEGKTPAEAKAARIAHYAGLRGKSKATGAPSPGKTVVPVKDAAGQVYFADPDVLAKLIGTSTTKPEFAGLASAPLPVAGTASIEEIDKAEWESAWLSTAAEPCASVDWTKFSCPVDEDTLAGIMPLEQSQQTAFAALDSNPFFADTGASSHITHAKSDFVALHAITPRPVRGIGDSSILAHGIGKVRLPVAKGSSIILQHVLYIPGCTVRLLSISALARDSNAAAYFDHESVKITDRTTGAFIAGGRLLPDSHLYAITLYATITENAFATRHSPNLATWHRRLGHANYQAITEMAKAGLLDGVSSTSLTTTPKCDHCILGKQTKKPVPQVRQEGPGHRATRKLGIVWIDLSGPSPVQSRYGNHYVMNLVDDYTSKPWSIPLKRKSDALGELKAWELAREVETGSKVGVYRTGFDGELKSHQMDRWLQSRGTEQQHGAPYTSAHIGRVERMHRTLMAKARTMRIAAGCPPNLWDEFYLTAAHLHEKPLPSPSMESPSTKCGTTASPTILIFVKLAVGRYGWKSKTYRCYECKTGKVYESYHVRFLETHEGHPTHPPELPQDVTPDEISVLHKIDSNTPHHTLIDEDEQLIPPSVPDSIPAPQNDPVLLPPPDEPAPPDPPPLPAPRRSSRILTPTQKANPDNPPETRVERAVRESKEAATRVRAARTERRRHATQAIKEEDDVDRLTRALDDLNLGPPDIANLAAAADVDPDQLFALITESGGVDPASLVSEDEPRTWREAQASADARRWEEGYRDELKSLKDMGVYKLVPRSDVPHGQKIRKGRPIFKIKRDETGKAVRFKVRLVFKGYEQIYGQDYTKTTSPTARMESWRILLHLAAAKNWDATQIDVKTAFLYGLLPEDEIQYMEQPEGFEEPGKEDWVWCLVRGLYGMKQSGRIWNKTLNENMISWGFTRLACESCIYYRKTDTGTTIAAVHVDDFLSIASSKAENDSFKDQMRKVWTISDLGTPRFVVGIAIEWDRPRRSVRLSQTALIDKIITQFGQKDAAPVSLPMDPGLKLRRVDRASLPTEEQEILARTPYRSLVGCLLYTGCEGQYSDKRYPDKTDKVLFVCLGHF